jgi:hypothetical protein
MKTAMQEMILLLMENQYEISPRLIVSAKKLLEKEKKQILAAYNNGSQDMALRDEYNPAEYYNQTYNQNK